MSTIQVNINTTPFIVEELDRMIGENIFSSKSEAINEAIHLLIKKYRLSKIEKKIDSVRMDTENFRSVTEAVLSSREEED
ncbi:MAG: ribbon-helix-helix domain-containing protein [Candidatus Syntropharchaeales archaeon]